MKKLLFVLIVLAGLLAGAFLYITRPVSAPSVPTETDETTVSTQESDSADIQTFTLDPARSEAKFEINEVLNNEPFRVVGTTKNVAGEINLNPANPNLTDTSIIRINARTLKTDSERRDGMIGRVILKSEANEFITFAPQSFSGLPTNPEVGQEYSFTTLGTLTIAGTSRDVTFTVKAKANSESEIQGLATASINYTDFALTIPSVPMVASVDERVDLTFSFVAVKK